MSEQYITKAEFDAKMETLKAMHDATNKRIDDLKDDVGRNLSGVGIIIAVVGVLLVMVQIAIAVLPHMK